MPLCWAAPPDALLGQCRDCETFATRGLDARRSFGTQAVCPANLRVGDEQAVTVTIPAYLLTPDTEYQLALMFNDGCAWRAPTPAHPRITSVIARQTKL